MRAARRSRADGNRSRAFQDLERVHTSLCREVVGRRRGVGGRRNQHAVFEKRDPCAAVEPGAANADIRPEAKAFFLLHVDAGYRAQHAQDIRA